MSIRIVLMLIGVWMLMGCAHNEVVDKNKEQRPIAFRNLNDKVVKSATRLANEDNDPYGVFAMWNRNSNRSLYMYNVKVTPDADGMNDTYSPLRYWPHEGTLDFTAYAPHSDLIADRWDVDMDERKLTYTVPADVNGFDGALEDFIYTIKFNNTADDGVVALEFEHMLTKIRIGLKLDETIESYGYSLNHTPVIVQLKVPSEKGTLPLSSPAPVMTAVVGGAPVTYHQKFKVGAFVTDPAFNIIPQLANGVKITLDDVEVYEVPIEQQNPQNLYWSGSFENIDLGDALEQAFGTNYTLLSGTIYHINIVIGADGGVFGKKVTFEVETKDWGNVFVDMEEENNSGGGGNG